MTIPHVLLGRTGLKVSQLALGAGPVSGLMTGHDIEKQRDVVRTAIDAGINWVDTAPGYGNGSSEEAIGLVLSQEPTTSRIQIASKVRFVPTGRGGLFRDQILRSVDASLRRLRVSQLTLLQLHNGLTQLEGDEPSSVSADDVLRSDGIADAMEFVRESGLTRYIGLTGTGHPMALRAVVRSGRFDTMQVPYNLLNPSAGMTMAANIPGSNYGNIMADCHEQQMGVFAIRVFAAGAILQQPPGSHTKTTPYFPLSLYEQDRQLASRVLSGKTTAEAVRTAIRFSLNHQAVHSAIIGFASPEQIRIAADSLADPGSGCSRGCLSK